MTQATFEVTVLVEAYRLAKREEAAAKKRADELKSALGEALSRLARMSLPRVIAC